MDAKPYHDYRLLLFSTICLVFAPLAYFYIDRPLVDFASHVHTHRFHLLIWFTDISPLIVVLVHLFLLGFLLKLIFFRLTPKETFLFLWSCYMEFLIILTKLLKFLFGRTWPDTWTHNNLSYLHNHIYGFFPLHGGVGYNSFPSGHSIVVFGALSVFWLIAPRFRIWYASICFLVAFSLVTLYFHYLSDVLVGAAIGTLAGLVFVNYWFSTHRILLF